MAINDTGITEETMQLHLRTFENYLARQSEDYSRMCSTMSQLSTSMNELVIAERMRAESDKRVQEQIDTLKSSLEKNAEGIAWSSKMSKWIDNYIMKIAAPFTITAIILLIVANTFDFTKLVGR